MEVGNLVKTIPLYASELSNMSSHGMILEKSINGKFKKHSDDYQYKVMWFNNKSIICKNKDNIEYYYDYDFENHKFISVI